MVFTGIIFVVYGIVLANIKEVPLNPSYAALFGVGVFVSALSQIGDLIASLVKRKYNVKDYGWLFPGHGGVMDRFDSVLITAPFLLMVAALATLVKIF